MTWTPETNETIWALLTDEQKEAMKAAKHGWIRFEAAFNRWHGIRFPEWWVGVVYRAKPAPKWEPPAELWALLRPEIVAFAKHKHGNWWAFTVVPEIGDSIWRNKGYAQPLEALNLPDIPWEESLFIRPGRE